MLSYTYDQVKGQISIWRNEVPVQTVMHTAELSFDHKQKLTLIASVKQFFLTHFNIKKSSIYETYVQLPSAAVTYLVIATPIDSLRPKIFSFPLIGDFPYLGFFDLEKARAKASELNETHFTFLRPVYAYSTLGYFNDPILSSFLHFDPMELEELIFHELFHTLFFISGDVDLNENLADYFARELMQHYYLNQLNKKDAWEKFLLKSQSQIKRREFLVSVAHRYEALLQKSRPTSKTQAQELWNTFLIDLGDPELAKINTPAALASFMTYQKHQNALESLTWRGGKTPAEKFAKIEMLYYQFIRDRKNKLNFMDYLIRNI
jgi:predicted aminopeptidase